MKGSKILVDFDVISGIQFCSSCFSWGRTESVGKTYPSIPGESHVIHSFTINMSCNSTVCKLSAKPDVLK